MAVTFHFMNETMRASPLPPPVTFFQNLGVILLIAAVVFLFICLLEADWGEMEAKRRNKKMSTEDILESLKEDLPPPLPEKWLEQEEGRSYFEKAMNRNLRGMDPYSQEVAKAGMSFFKKMWPRTMKVATSLMEESDVRPFEPAAQPERTE